MGCLDVLIGLVRSALSVAVIVACGLCVRFSRLGGVRVLLERVGGSCVMCERIKTDVGVNVGLICSVGVGKYEYLACSDLGFIRTFDKGFIIVPKR